MTDSFSLVSEPWIKVRGADQEVVELSLRDVIAQSPRIAGFAGEMATQDAAILRLVLAVLLGATRPEAPRYQDEADELWSSWWRMGEFPMDVVDAYLMAHRARFDLLGPTPFMQVADLSTRSGKRSGLPKLVAEVPDGQQYFTARRFPEGTTLTYAEASRWLVHCQAYDPSGIKTGASGDPRVSGGRGYPQGVAFTGLLGLVIAEGRNLFETLLLNLPLSHANSHDDVPAWERPPVGPGPDETHPYPLGPADAFTWQSRRLRLVCEGGRVTDVQVSYGDKLTPQNMHSIETMASWRHSPNQAKALKVDEVMMPVTHDPSRRVWQGLGPLLQDGVSGGRRVKRADTLETLARLMNNRDLDPGYRVGFRTVGIQYGSQSSVVDDVVNDVLHARLEALTDPLLVQAAVDAAEVAQQAMIALVNLATNLARAAGRDPRDPGDDAFRGTVRESGFAMLDPLFRSWIGTLTSAEPAVAAHGRWQAEVYKRLRSTGRQLVTEAGPAAWSGHEIEVFGRADKVNLDSALAELWFLSALRKALPLIASTERKDVA